MTRRERLERRAERLQEWAEKREHDAGAVLASHERYRGCHAFNFQPGHIPERARVIKQAERAFESLDKAAGMENRAAGIEAQLRSSIYSDDVDAVEQLAERIERLEGERDRIKRYNASCRKGARDVEILDEKQRAELASTAKACPYQIGEKGEAPSYWLTNLGGNIRRNKQRLEQIQRENALRESGSRGRGRPMLARFSSSCADCGEQIEKGSPINYYRLTREAVHVDCGKES